MSTSKSDFTKEKNWRSQLTNQKEIMNQVFSSQLFGNALLIVGSNGSRIKVIKELLQSLSPYLDKKLGLVEGDLDENGLPVFNFEHVDEESMKILLKFAYTHEWSWSNDIDDLDSLLRFRHFVSQFEIEHLFHQIQFCIDNFKSTFVNCKTACQVFEKTNNFQFDEANLTNLALELILSSPKQIFENVENYRMLTSASFLKILQNDNLQVDNEVELFQIVLRWAKAQTMGFESDESPEDLGRILKDILPLIRFTHMTLNDFNQIVVPTRLLETTQVSKVQKILQLKATGKTVQLEKPRKYQIPQFDMLPHTSSSENEFSNRLVYKTHEFGGFQKRELFHKVNKLKEDELLQLNIKVLTDTTTLMSFLSKTATKSFKLNLTVDVIKFNPNPKSSSITFSQINSVTFESIEEETQLNCLIEIVKRSPNLRQLSIASFEWCIYNSETSFSNLTKFFRSVSLSKIEFSCGLLGSPELSKYLLELKRNGVCFKRAGFKVWSTTTHRFDVVQLLQDDLEEIHYFNHSSPDLTFQCTLNKLKYFNVRCDTDILLDVLKRTPNLKKLTWHAFGYVQSFTNHQNINLPQLKTLFVFWHNAQNLEHTEQFFSKCPKLCRLTIINWCCTQMTSIYTKFPRLEKLRLLEHGGLSLDNLFSAGQLALEGHRVDSSVQSRTDYIGNLSELQTLSFGYKDYQHNSLVSPWNLSMKAFTRGIRHLTKLQKIILPPMRFDQATTILSYLTASMKHIKLVQLQVWFDKIEGQNGTMKMIEIEKLIEVHSKLINVEAIQIRPEDSSRWLLY